MCSLGKKLCLPLDPYLDGSNHKTIVWGAGFREYNSKFNDCSDIYAVRGLMTLNKLPKRYRRDKIACGDPALLLPYVYPSPLYIKK